MGGFDHRSSGTGAPGGPTIVINGAAIMGGVDVRRRPPRKSKRDAELDPRRDYRQERLEARRERLDARREYRHERLEAGETTYGTGETPGTPTKPTDLVTYRHGRAHLQLSHRLNPFPGSAV